GADIDELDGLLFNHPGITAAPQVQDVGGTPTEVANTFVVTVAADVPLGVYELRAKGLFGLSNPRAFVVGNRDEIQETEPNSTPEQAAKVPLNTVVNGRSNGGADLDYMKFDGKQGQRV